MEEKQAIHMKPSVMGSYASRDSLWVVFLTLAYSFAVLAIAQAFDEMQLFAPFAYARHLNLAALIFAGVALVIRYAELRFGAASNPWAELKSEIRCEVLEPSKLVMRFVPFLLLPLFIGSFTSFKSMLPSLHPFRFDSLFAETDRWLHFGIDPWQITHAVFSGPYATQFINIIYNSWIGVMWVAVLYHTVVLTRPHLRSQFLISFLICWIVLGSFMALGLSSAGPCYFGVVTGEADPFQPLMQRLFDYHAMFGANDGGMGLTAITTQDMLWQAYQAGHNELGSGISAMPSMHVSIATLIALSSFHISKRLGIAATIYAAFILIGSVHLGWHYAIDGYVSILATALIWRLSARLNGGDPSQGQT